MPKYVPKSHNKYPEYSDTLEEAWNKIFTGKANVALKVERDILVERINEALDMAFNNSQVDGSHHKMWCIDQMVRILTGCTEVEKNVTLRNGLTYKTVVLNESEEYKKFVSRFENTDDPDEGNWYEWDKGIE